MCILSIRIHESIVGSIKCISTRVYSFCMESVPIHLTELHYAIQSDFVKVFVRIKTSKLSSTFTTTSSLLVRLLLLRLVRLDY